MIIFLGFLGLGVLPWILGYMYGKDYGYRKGWEDCSVYAEKNYREVFEKEELNHETRNRTRIETLERN